MFNFIRILFLFIILFASLIIVLNLLQLPWEKSVIITIVSIIGLIIYNKCKKNSNAIHRGFWYNYWNDTKCTLIPVMFVIGLLTIVNSVKIYFKL